MAEINVLSSKIYNRIAAGEVVERPYSVVKELVENSIDAKAKHITVEIHNGGNSYIKITDDGIGIEKSQLTKALLPHATSKISKLSDLDNILSLGFRGEALASIASVSKLTITSKPNGQEVGASIYSEGGVIEEITDFPSALGTEITVKNLFFNTPAREKFLKTDRAEEGEIASIISKLILSKPELSFTLISNGKTILQSFGDGIESAMVSVYGKEIIDDCFYIDTEKNGIKIKGYIGKHNFSKPNRTYQSLFVNGRYVINQTVSASISNAYANYLMKRQYPFYVLSIDLPSDSVDVNVHPSKIEVRFANNQIVYSSVYSVISKVLDGGKEALNIVVDDKKFIPKFENISSSNENKNNDEIYKFNKLVFADSKNDFSFNEKMKNENEQKNNVVDIFAENKAYLEQLEKQKQENSVQTKVVIEKDLRYIGQALNTYLIFDDGENLYFIDQHAAHERILFDKFMGQIKDRKFDIQPLLVPYVEEVNENEFNFLVSKLNVLNEMGIEVSEFGANTIKISALPTCLIGIDIKDFLSGILFDLNQLKSITIIDLLKEKIAQKACKSAIKSGDKLNDADIKIIMEEIKMDLGLKCPHGRPIAIKITRNEIDKWFKRIV